MQGSPMTSEIISDSTPRRSRPAGQLAALDLGQVLADGIELVDGGPAAQQASVVATFSSREMPSAGAGIRAEPPPENRHSTTSSGPRPSTSRSMRAVPATPAASGRGCPHSTVWTVFNSRRWPYLVLMEPAVRRGPSTASAAAAMAGVALPAPTTTTREAPERGRR